VSHQFIGNVPQALERFQLQSCLKLIDNISYRSHRPLSNPNIFSGGDRRPRGEIKVALAAINIADATSPVNEFARNRSLPARCLCILRNCNSPSCGDDAGA